MRCKPYYGEIESDDYIYLLQAQCDRWGVKLYDGLHSTCRHHVAMRALVCKILHQSGFTTANIERACGHDYKTILNLIRNCHKYERALVLWRNTESKNKRRYKPHKTDRRAGIQVPRKPRIRLNSKPKVIAPSVAPMVIAPPPMPMPASFSVAAPVDCIPPISLARLMGAR